MIRAYIFVVINYYFRLDKTSLYIYSYNNSIVLNTLYRFRKNQGLLYNPLSRL